MLDHVRKIITAMQTQYPIIHSNVFHQMQKRRMLNMNTMSSVTEKFLRYVSYNTTSEDDVDKIPSTQSQFVLANLLAGAKGLCLFY